MSIHAATGGKLSLTSSSFILLRCWFRSQECLFQPYLHGHATWIRLREGCENSTNRTRSSAFWDNWMKTVSAIVPKDGFYNADTESRFRWGVAFARQHLAESSWHVFHIYRQRERKQLRKYSRGFAAFKKYRARLPGYRRAFLLYKAPNPLAKAFKLLFHLYLTLPIQLLLITVFIAVFAPHIDKIIGVSPNRTPPPHFLVAHPAVPVTRFFIGLAVWVVAVLLLRRSSIRFENDRWRYVRDQVRRGYSLKWKTGPDSTTNAGAT